MAIDRKQDRNVSADMERVFGLSADADEEPAGGTRRADPVPPSAAGQPRRWLLIAAPVLATLFLMALAVRFALTLVPADVGEPATRPSPRPAIEAASPAPTPTLVPDRTESLSPDDFGPAPVEPIPAAPATPAPPRRAVERVRPAPRAARDCPPGSTENRCIFADVLAADRRLRTAYARATQAGVPTRELVTIRRRWNRARGISLDAPDETIRRYDELAARLDDLIENEQR